MSQTTMKIDRDVLADLKELANITHRTPQKFLRFLMAREKAKLELLETLTPEQKERAEIIRQTEASEALEGYAPLSEVGGYAYELQQKWVNGEITIKQRIELLKKHRELT